MRIWACICIVLYSCIIVTCPFTYIVYDRIWLSENKLSLHLFLCSSKSYFKQFNKWWIVGVSHFLTVCIGKQMDKAFLGKIGNLSCLERILNKWKYLKTTDTKIFLIKSYFVEAYLIIYPFVLNFVYLQSIHVWNYY